MGRVVDDEVAHPVVAELAAVALEVVAVLGGDLGLAQAAAAGVVGHAAAHAQVDVLAGRLLVQARAPLLVVDGDDEFAAVHVAVVAGGDDAPGGLLLGVVLLVDGGGLAHVGAVVVLAQPAVQPDGGGHAALGLRRGVVHGVLVEGVAVAVGAVALHGAGGDDVQQRPPALGADAVQHVGEGRAALQHGGLVHAGGPRGSDDLHRVHAQVERLGDDSLVHHGSCPP